ncbi:MAG: hypothetical protein ACJ8BW_30445 [Ktedonobacteraceae bacterium]
MRPLEEQEAFQKARDAWNKQAVPQDKKLELYEEAHTLRRQAKAIHVEILKKLIDLLTTFYTDRQVPYDCRLVIQIRVRGSYRLESQGAELLETAPQEIGQPKLQEYQEEMQAFTRFLKEIYFSEDTSASSS